MLARRAQIQQIIFNLLRNAIVASGGPAPQLTASTGLGGMAETRVTDSGRESSAEAVGDLFGPFRSTKPDFVGISHSI